MSDHITMKGPFHTKTPTLSRIHFRLFFVLVIGVVTLGLTSQPIWAQSQVGLYEPWEVAIKNNKSYSNPFDFTEIELRATFRAPSGKQFNAIGFYDGDGNGKQTGNVWKLRFMPDEQGNWTYSYTWSDNSSGGNGSFTVTQSINPENHGHVHVDPDNPRYLIHDDGVPHYWWGANWVHAGTFGPASKWGQSNPGCTDNAQFTAHLNLLEAYDHNGLLLKTGLYPLENDKLTWDLSWLHREEWLLREMLTRGIYAQVNFFDTWSRVPPGWGDDTNGSNHLFNVWASGDEKAKQNYIKNLVARFSGFPNVYWELGNEMEHSNSGTNFASQANSKYIPWIRQADPYDLPIGLSEGVWQNTNVDIGFLHQSTQLPQSNWNKPTIMNELVQGGITDELWNDDAIRNGSNRISYRRTFWRMFTYGGVGSSEATWIEFETPPNQAVLNVMADQQRLRQFIERLPLNINEMDPNGSFVKSGPGSYSTRSKSGEGYVTYFLLNPGQTRQAGTVKVDLPAGSYEVEWYDPKVGSVLSSTEITTGGGQVTLAYPQFTEDIVLQVLNKTVIQAMGYTGDFMIKDNVGTLKLNDQLINPKKIIDSALFFIYLPILSQHGEC